jgi:hypothetical protein
MDSDQKRYRASLARKADLLRALMGDELWGKGDWLDWRWRFGPIMVCPRWSEILVCTDHTDTAKFNWADPDLMEKLRADVRKRFGDWL